MKESLISEKIYEHRAALRSINTKNRQTVAEVRRDAENRIEHEARLAQSAAEESRNLQEYIKTINQEDEQSVTLLLDYVNDRLASRKLLINRIATWTAILLEICSAILAYLYPNAATITLVATVSTIFVSHMSGFLGKIVGDGSASYEVANARLYDEAIKRGMTSKLKRFDISLTNNKFSVDMLKNQRPASGFLSI